MQTSGITSQIATVDYLQLLTVQLQNQDPIDPVDQEGMINDLAQFSMLEGIESMNVSFESMLQMQQVTQGVDLVGKNIQYQDAEGQVKTGRVDELFTAGGSIDLIVDGQSVSIANVVSVLSDSAAA